MGYRKTAFVEGEFYHIYNRGVDKRNIFLHQDDFDRFLCSMVEFNAVDPIGSIYENSFRRLGSESSKSSDAEDSGGSLVDFVAYCLNPNHYHFLVRQNAEKGIEKFMQRIGTGYTKFFNNKYERSGSLFQGVFKSIHVDSNKYLLHLSAYVNLNNRGHQLGSEASKLMPAISSWGEYTDEYIEGICVKEPILSQFENLDAYEKFATSSLQSIIQRKEDLRDIDRLLLE